MDHQIWHLKLLWCIPVSLHRAAQQQQNGHKKHLFANFTAAKHRNRANVLLKDHRAALSMCNGTKLKEKSYIYTENYTFSSKLGIRLQ